MTKVLHNDESRTRLQVRSKILNFLDRNVDCGRI